MSRSDGRQAALGGSRGRPEWLDRLETVVGGEVIAEEWEDLPESIAEKIRGYEAPLAAGNYKTSLHAPELSVGEVAAGEGEELVLRVQPACGSRWPKSGGSLREVRTAAAWREICGRADCQEAAAEMAAIVGVREEISIDKGGGGEQPKTPTSSKRLRAGLLGIDPETLPGDEWPEAVTRRLYARRNGVDGWRTGEFDDAELEEVLDGE